MPFTPEDDIRLSIRMGLTKGPPAGPRFGRQLDEDERNRIAEAIREHLALAGWRIEPGPGIGGHSQLWAQLTIVMVLSEVKVGQRPRAFRAA